MRARLPLIISTAAGAGRPERVEAQVRGALEASHAPDISYVRSLDELRAAIGAELAHATPTIGIGGGDGTLHHAINAIGDAPVTLAPLPLGTGNDFCRGLGFHTLDQALAATSRQQARRVDLLEVNGRRVATVAGLGVVAASALRVCRLGRPGSPLRPAVRALGSHAYLVSGGLHLLLDPRLASDVQLRWRDQRDATAHTIDGRYYGAFLAVMPTLGAGMRLPLEIQPDDGRFEVAMVETAPRLKVAWNLPRLRRGRRLSDGIVRVRHAIECEIEWVGGTAVLGDGEDLGFATRVRACMLPRALSVVAG